jgi:hypothetical protein
MQTFSLSSDLRTDGKLVGREKHVYVENLHHCNLEAELELLQRPEKERRFFSEDTQISSALCIGFMYWVPISLHAHKSKEDSSVTSFGDVTTICFPC